jgi:CHAT domain-containing protein/tetratricopeptide (TPR) repeat protein
VTTRLGCFRKAQQGVFLVLAFRLQTLLLILTVAFWPVALAAQEPSPQARRLLEKANAALLLRQYSEAAKTFAQALPLITSPEDAQLRTDTVLTLAQAHLAQQDWDAVQSLLDKEWSLFERHPDPERLDRAQYFMMYLLLQKADYAAATRYSSVMLERVSGRLGPEHPHTLGIKLNHGSALINAGKADEGERLLDAALDAIKLTDKPAQYLDQVYGVGNALEVTQQYASAARYYKRYLEAAAKLPESRDIGILHQKLAVVLSHQGLWQEALPHYEQALNILNRVVGPDDVTAISALGGLGSAYMQIGRPASGLQFLEQGYERARKVLGEDNPETWTDANNLAGALRELERFQEAYDIDVKVLEWQTKNRPDDMAVIESSMLNTALDLLGLKRAKEANSLFRKVHASRLKRLGKDHPKTKEVSEYLRLYESKDPSLRQARRKPEEIAKLSYFEANAEGIALSDQGKRKQALPFYQRAFEASITENGPYNPTTLILQRNLALLHMNLDGSGRGGIPVYRDLSQRMLNWARTEIAATAGKARSEDIRRFANHMIFDVIKLAEQNPQAHDLLFQVSLDWKGLGTAEQSVLNGLRSAPPNSRVTDLLARHAELQNKLRVAGQQVEDVRSELNLVEVKLAEESIAFRTFRADADIKPDDVIKRMGRDDVLIDYIIGDREERDSNNKVQHLFAFVTLADGRAIVKDLGKLEAVKTILAKAGYEARDEDRADLHDLLLKPVLAMKSVAKKKRLFIVPDGELFLVPFDGLIDANGKPLGARFDVSLMRSASGLLREDLAVKNDRPVLLVGAPNYGQGGGGLDFPRLPGAFQEVQTIAAMMQAKGLAASVITGDAAREDRVREAVARMRIVHMATHGFFLKSDFDPALEPPWRGGLALLGANHAMPDGRYRDDGVAYAAELANWPLSETDLVVLSACETASGERSYVEGLRGIPAALAIAGAKFSLLAYWEVPDEGAANFMTAFYRNLLTNSGGYEAAFRATKREAMQGKIAGAEAPEVWQAFVMMRN